MKTKTNTNGQTEIIHKWPINRVHISERNTRHPKPNEPGIKELTESIKTFGQTTPAIGRYHPKKGKEHIELGAGARRRVASEAAGKTTLDVIIRDMDDAKLEEMIVIENFQREDPDPRAEVAVLDRLVNKHKMTSAEISAHLGKPEHWVTRRLRLLKVIPEIRKQWESGRHNRFTNYSVEMMELIGSLDTGTQQALFKSQDTWWLQHAHSRAELQKELEKHIFCRLDSAPFDLNDPKFFVKGCGPGCASDSSKQGALFDMSNGDRRCLNCECFQSRIGKWRKSLLEAVRKEHDIKKDLPLLVSGEGYGNPGSIRIGDKDFRLQTPDWGWKVASEPPKTGKAQQVYVTDRAGTKFRIGYLVKGRESSGGGSRSSRPKLSQAESMAARKKMLEGKRWSLVHDQLHEALYKCPHSKVTEPIEDLVAVFGLPSEYHASSHDTNMPGTGKDTEGVYHWKVFDERKKKGFPSYEYHELYEAYDDTLKYLDHRNAALWSGLQKVLADVMKGFCKVSDAGESEYNMRRVAKLISFDITKAKREADLQIPPPKSWGKVDVHTLEPLIEAVKKNRKK